MPGHFFVACHTVSVVFTPHFFASSFFATTTPSLFSGSPATAMGTSLNSGRSNISQDAKKLLQSQWKIRRGFFSMTATSFAISFALFNDIISKTQISINRSISIHEKENDPSENALRVCGKVLAENRNHLVFDNKIAMLDLRHGTDSGIISDGLKQLTSIFFHQKL